MLSAELSVFRHNGTRKGGQREVTRPGIRRRDVDEAFTSFPL
jgi:hypothetical protein